MTVETQLRTALLANASFTAICGQRVYAGILPQNASLPAVVYNRVVTERESAMGVDPGPTMARVQFTCFAENTATVSGYDQALAAAEALRVVLQRYRSGVVQDVFLELETDTFEADTRKHGRTIDVRVHFRES